MAFKDEEWDWQITKLKDGTVNVDIGTLADDLGATVAANTLGKALLTVASTLLAARDIDDDDDWTDTYEDDEED